MASKRISRAALRALVADGSVHVEFALVVERAHPVTQEPAHFEVTPNAARPGHQQDVLVYADVMPSQQPAEVSLSGEAGCWDVPAVGSLLCIAVPGGELEGHDPVLVGVVVGLEGAPVGLDGETTLLGCAGKPKVKIGAGAGTQPSVLGTNLEARLSKLEADFYGHFHETSTGITGEPEAPPTLDPTIPHNPVAGDRQGRRIDNPAYNAMDPYAIDPTTGRTFPQYLYLPPVGGAGILSTIVEVA